MQSAAFLRKINRKSYFGFANAHLKIKLPHSAELLILRFLETFYGKICNGNKKGSENLLMERYIKMPYRSVSFLQIVSSGKIHTSTYSFLVTLVLHKKLDLLSYWKPNNEWPFAFVAESFFKSFCYILEVFFFSLEERFSSSP